MRHIVLHKRSAKDLSGLLLAPLLRKRRTPARLKSVHAVFMEIYTRLKRGAHAPREKEHVPKLQVAHGSVMIFVLA